MPREQQSGFKERLQGLPTTPLRVLASVCVFVLTSLVVIGRIAFGFNLPDNAEWFFAMILGVMGVDTAHYFAKRRTEWRPSPEMVDMTTHKDLDPEKVALTDEYPVPGPPKRGRSKAGASK